MWCSSCREDVLIVTSVQNSSASECIQCRRIIFLHPPQNVIRAPLGGADLWNVPVDSTGRWTRLPISTKRSEKLVRQDPPHFEPEGIERIERPRLLPKRPTGLRHSQLLVWSALSLGLAALTFGIVLGSWTLFHDRPDLLRIALPVGLGGLTTFLVGMVLQIDVSTLRSSQLIQQFGISAIRKSQNSDNSVSIDKCRPIDDMRQLDAQLQEFASQISRRS